VIATVPFGRRWPDKSAALQPLGVERHADPVVPENLDQMAALAAEHVEIAAMRIALRKRSVRLSITHI
jgi:hypothetical protein